MKWTIGFLFLASTSFALPVRQGERFKVLIEGEYIVKAHPGEQKSLQGAQKIGHNLFLVKNVNKASLQGFEKVMPNYVYYGNYLEEIGSESNDPLFGKQFHHHMIKTTEAWKTTMGSPDIIVAVTDNEFQLDHDDMVNAWYINNKEIPDNGIDDDKNGYVDDYLGWDFAERDANVNNDSSTHGTHVSGTIAAAADNDIGGVGIAPNIKIMPLRWYGSGSWTSAIVSETYHYAVDNGAKIITTSYNIDQFVNDEAYLDAVKYITQNGVLLFNSAGNNSQKNPPRQKVEDLILVCAVDSKDGFADTKADFSNYGTGIDICAPGNPILAPVRGRYPTTNESRHDKLSGTSMASPVAAAVAALIWSANPGFTAEEVKAKLLSSADNIDDLNPKYKGMLGAGRVNAQKAVEN